MRKSFVAVLMAFAVATSIVRAEDESKPKISSTPWHLMDAWWDLGADTPFESYSIDVTISDDVPAGTRLYISPIGLGKLSGISFYGGLQTRLDGNTKKERHLRELGPGVIFSMWGERSFDAIRAADGAFCQSSGHEGDFISVRRPYAWKKGKYTYKVVKLDREETSEGVCRWVGVFVYSHENDENIFGGALRFKGDDLVLNHSIANFIEIYGPVIPLSEIPKLTVTFGNPQVNGKPVQGASASVIYPKGVPDYANASAENGNLVVRVGEEVKDRSQRRVVVIAKPVAVGGEKK